MSKHTPGPCIRCAELESDLGFAAGQQEAVNALNERLAAATAAVDVATAALGKIAAMENQAANNAPRIARKALLDAQNAAALRAAGRLP